MSDWLEYAVVALLWLAAVLQIAVIRDRTVFDSRNGYSYRWLVVCGVVGLAAWLSYQLFIERDLQLPWYSLIFVGLLALGLFGLALDKFRPMAFMDTQPSAPMPLNSTSKGSTS